MRITENSARKPSSGYSRSGGAFKRSLLVGADSLLHNFKATVMLAALAVFALAALLPEAALSRDYGNVLKRKQDGTLPEQQEKKTDLEDYEKPFDTTLRIYLACEKETFEPGEKPVVQVYIRNEDTKTRFFKSVWTSTGAQGVAMKTIFDGVESVGSAFFSRKAVLPESQDPKDALRLDPNEQAHIMDVVFNDTPEGEHTLELQYAASYTVTESAQRNWWNGLTRSNVLTIKATRIIPEDKLAAAASSIIRSVHADIMKMKAAHPGIEGFSDSSLSTQAGSYMGIPVIEYSTVAPARRRIAVYFQKPDYEPSTLATYVEDFPYLGIKLFAHVETGEDTSLRSAVLDSVKRNRTLLYQTTKEIARNIRVQVEPFGPDLSKKLRRASYIVYGSVVSKEIEALNQYESDYEIRKWVLNVAVRKVYLGDVREKSLIIKSGTLTSFFGNETVENKAFIFLLGTKTNWQQEYTLIGVEPARENLLQWLDVKYKK